MRRIQRGGEESMPSKLFIFSFASIKTTTTKTNTIGNLRAIYLLVEHCLPDEDKPMH